MQEIFVILLTLCIFLGPAFLVQTAAPRPKDFLPPRPTGLEEDVALYEELMTAYSFTWYMQVAVSLGVAMVACIALKAFCRKVDALAVFPVAAWTTAGIFGYGCRFFCVHNLNQHKPLLKNHEFLQRTSDVLYWQRLRRHADACLHGENSDANRAFAR